MLTESFIFSDKARRYTLAMMLLGVFGLFLAFFLYPENHHSRMWSNLLLNSYFFTGVGIASIFFIAAHSVGYGGWHATIKRIPEAMGTIVPIMAIPMAIIIGTMFMPFGSQPHSLYGHWHMPIDQMDDIIKGKLAYLNVEFFALRIVIYFVLWTVLSRVMNKISFKEDSEGTSESSIKKHRFYATLFLIVFAVSESMFAWDAVMSIDAHWYSTLFGWYNFASYMCAALAFMVLFVIYLKSRGYLKPANDNHVHDLGKLLFGFSVFWAYLWFSQFLLIWYANVPEETVYFMYRMEIPLFKFIFFAAFIINFVMPMFIIMSRGGKRNYNTIGFMCVMLIIGHYLDFYNMVMPGSNKPHESHTEETHAMVEQSVDEVLFAENHESKDHTGEAVTEGDAHATDAHETKGEGSHANEHSSESHDKDNAAHGEEHHGSEDDHHGAHKEKLTHAGLGLVEIFIFIGFCGLFLNVVLRSFTKASLVAVNDPYLKESLDHHF